MPLATTQALPSRGCSVPPAVIGCILRGLAMMASRSVGCANLLEDSQTLELEDEMLEAFDRPVTTTHVPACCLINPAATA